MLLSLGLVVPLVSIPRVEAFHSQLTYSLTGTVVKDYSDQLLGTVDAAKEGSTVTFNVMIVANDFVVGQRNITVGVKFDWMTSFVNASNARPGQTLQLQAGGTAIVTVSVSIPALSGSYVGLNLATHSWQLRVWSSTENSAVTYSDCPHPQASLSGCEDRSGSRFAVYSNNQADGVLAREEANSKISVLSSTLSSLIELPPGAATAISDLSRARAELSSGDTSYSNGDFAGAKTHYTNALNLANSAASSLSSQGGGVDSASLANLILGGTGFLLAGVGVLLAGIGGLSYLRRRSKPATTAEKA